MQQRSANRQRGLDRRHFIGGSDARIIMGQDEKALIRLWQEKRGEVGPEDLSANLIVQSVPFVKTTVGNRTCPAAYLPGFRGGPADFAARPTFRSRTPGA
jgi:hypothetical protein